MVEAISNAVRTEVLRHLSARPMTAVELAAATEIVHSSIHRHLKVLEEQGLVVADQEADHRRGREVRWTTNAARVAEVAALWSSYATGGLVDGAE